MASNNFDHFRGIMDTFAKEVLAATGINERGEQIADPRFPGFELTNDIRLKVSSAVSLLKAGKVELAIERIEDALTHFKNKQVAYFRNSVKFFNRHIDQLEAEHVPDDLIDQVERKLEELEKYSKTKEIDLSDASEKYRAVADHVAHVRDEAQRRVRNAIARHEQERLERARNGQPTKRKGDAKKKETPSVVDEAILAKAREEADQLATDYAALFA